jgi:16S rRNA (uracil1498-N3)-methyltransferase
MHKNKHIPRIFHPDIYKNNLLSTENSFHLIKVLRLSNCSPFYIFNDKEGEFLAELIIEKQTCKFKVLNKIKDVETEKYTINLYYSPLKSTANDFLIEKTVELGISSLTQIKLDYTTIKPIPTEKLLIKTIESAKQCGRINIPTINPTISFKDLITHFTTDKNSTLFYFHNNSSTHLTQNLVQQTIKNNTINYIIGAEGGFSQQEDTNLTALQNIIKTKLHNNILRAETASITALISFKLLLNI